MSDYGPAARALHWMALAQPAICEVQFDLERRLHGAGAPSAGRHVFVAGLARAGTTILMRSIHATGGFGSLTYRDMPFILAPNLWATMNVRPARPGPAAERAHGDGILVDFDSPEALEEVFWRVFLGQTYLRDADGLTPHDVPEDLVEKFRAYVALVLKRTDKPRYLSKNNNNILRLDALLAAFPEARILVPFRAPDAHARSLLAQHRRFLAEDESDRFTRRYMGWLAHHEFGPGHRPFRFPGVDLAGLTPAEPAYWLSLWHGVYAHLADRYLGHDRIRFVCYEDMTRDPAAWTRLAATLGLPDGAASDYRITEDTHPTPGTDDAWTLYRRMREAAHLVPDPTVPRRKR